MKEYIEREAVVEMIKKNSTTRFDWSEAVDIEDLIPAIKDIPAADVAPVRYGEWLCDYDRDLGVTTVTCSNCKVSRDIKGCYVGIHDEPLYDEDDYCPNCGAMMRGG